MKKFPIIALIAAFILAMSSCLKNKEDKATELWRVHNEEWIDSLAQLKNPDGTAVYTRVNAKDDAAAFVLMRYLNDRNKTLGNLSPYPTSTVHIKYIGRNCYNEAFDSSYSSTDPADSVVAFVPSGLVTGFSIALQDMRVGDSCRVAIPWLYAYGSSGMGDIPAYSALQFDIKLVDIAHYIEGSN